MTLANASELTYFVSLSGCYHLTNYRKLTHGLKEEMCSNYMNSETYSEKDWLDGLYRKSSSENSRRAGRTSLVMFDMFCKDQGMTREQMIQKYQRFFSKERPDVRSVCMSLNKFVNFLYEDRDDIELNERTKAKFKKKSASSIKGYFSFLKSYLRICCDIRLTNEDVKDYITFPKKRRIPRKPVTIEQVKAICANASPDRRALYYILITSAMRISEALQLKKSDFHTNETPVRIVVQAENTKTKQERETYITKEAYEKVKPILESKGDDEYLFWDTKYELFEQLIYEEKVFGHLRQKLGYTEKYQGSIRYVVTLHAFRAYCHTKATKKHDTSYAHALDGHSGYLEGYYRNTAEERATMYLELEPELLIESVVLDSEKRKDEEIARLRADVEELKASLKRKVPATA